MKFTKVRKVLILTMIALTLLGTYSNVFGFSLDDIFSAGKGFIDKGSQDAPISTDDAINAFVPVGITLVGIATIVLVVVGLIMGVKYMIAGANEKAELKQKLIYYVISVVLVYGATGIFALVIQVFNNILD